MRVRIVILCAGLSATASAQAAVSIPDWYLNLPRAAGRVAGTGSGESNITALASAMGQAVDVLKAPIPKRLDESRVDFGAPTQTLATERLGSLTINTSTFSASETVRTDSVVKTFRRSIHVTTSDSSTVLTYSSQQVGGKIKYTLHMTGPLRGILDGLKAADADVRLEQRGDLYYALVMVPAATKSGGR